MIELPVGVYLMYPSSFIHFNVDPRSKVLQSLLRLPFGVENPCYPCWLDTKPWRKAAMGIQLKGLTCVVYLDTNSHICRENEEINP
jgi:hypothetical protein